MAQWFKSLKLFLLKLLGVGPVSIALDLEATDAIIKRSALLIHTYAKDEAMAAMFSLLKAQQTRTLYSLSTFNGTPLNLAKLQGQLQAIEGLISFVKEAESLSAAEVRGLRAQKQQEVKSKVLHLGKIQSRQDTVI